MSTRFIKDNDEVWDIILDHLRRARDQRAAAISYCTELSLLPLKAGDVLVCDASEHAIVARLTKAETLHELVVNRGVKVFSLEGLHAKVVLAGNYAIVGSMNASLRSLNSLREAAIVSDELAVVMAAEAWIEKLCAEGERLTPARVRELCKIYVEPVGGYVPPGKKIKAQKANRVTTKKNWFYLYSHASGWTREFASQVRPVLKRLRRESADPSIIVDAIEYDPVPRRLGFRSGSNFFLGHFGARAKEPMVYRDCEAIGLVEGGFLYTYPSDGKLADWTAFREAAGKSLAYPHGGEVERRIPRRTAERIRGNWHYLVKASERR